MNRINAPDGTPLVYDVYEPPPPGPQAAVLFLHDWSPRGLSDSWKPTGMALRDAGLAAYFLDQRGAGRSGGRRGHLSRFSQLLGDLQAFRRAVRQRHDVPQVLFGHGFGALIVLRYLETQPGEPPAAAIVSSPLLASRVRPAVWKRIAAKFADVWPTLATGRGNGYMTAGARAELQWAQHAVVTDARRIERPLLFLLGGADGVVDAALARRFADGLAIARTEWYPELAHDLFNVQQVIKDIVAFVLANHSSERIPRSQ